MAVQLRLQPVAGPKLGRFVLPPGRAARLGRAPSCDVRLPDPAISPQHALFSNRGERWFLTDLGGAGGTRLNGIRLSIGHPAMLGEDDFLEIGPWTFRVAIGHARVRPITQIEETPDTAHPAERVSEAELDLTAQQRLARLVEFVAEANNAQSEGDLAELVVRSALTGTGFPRAAMLMLRGTDEDVDVVCARARDPEEAGTFEVSRKLIREAMTGRLVWLSRDGSGRRLADLGIHSALCAPVRVGASVAALVYLDARGGERGVRQDAPDFCATLAVIAGLSLANLKRVELQNRHRRLTAELDAAREAQQLIVPAEQGRRAGLGYSVRMHPGMVVAGDLFDVVGVPEDRVAVLIGDVTGTGVGAGILMVAVQAHLHASLRRDPDPASALEAANRYVVAHSAENRFVSLWVGIFDRGTGLLRYVDAGHGHWLIADPDGAVAEAPHPGGIPVGIDASTGYRAEETDFRPGQRIVLFSDGVVEQRSPAGEQFGARRVRDAVTPSRSAEEDVRGIYRALVRFTGTEALDDDTTIASVEWAEEEEAEEAEEA